MTVNWQEQALDSLHEGNYSEVARFYEQAIEVEPEYRSHYWYLGLAYLLQGEEEEAQTTWLFAISEGMPEEVEQWTEELIEVLHTEAQRQESLGQYQTSWLIRGHLRELAPILLNNLFYLIQIAIKLDYFSPNLIKEWQITELLRQSPINTVDPKLLVQTLAKVLQFPAEESLTVLEASLPHINQKETFLSTVIPIAIQLAYQKRQPVFAASIAQLCLKLYPNNLYVFKHLYGFYLYARDHQKAVETAHQFYQHSHSVALKLFGNYQLLQALMGAGAWQEVTKIVERHKSLLAKIAQEQPTTIDRFASNSLVCVAGSLLYLEDNPQQNRRYQNQVAQLFQTDFCARTPALIQPSRSIKDSQALKIGYIAHTLKQHSVGWLSRWLFQYHNREAFQVVLYMINQAEDELTQGWFRQNASIARNLKPDARAIAAQIQEDRIDIMVDLDSITLDVTCQVMALKPAPIQATWLGFEASGLPAIDYFIADPYVLPDNAQNYYSETIWRLPQTYIAINGFEVGVPTLRRDELGIPTDAVIYLSAQNGFKRHPQTIRLQMKILKEVANSYFLIKGVADEQVIQQLFTQLAEEEGVNPARLRFLPRDVSEYVHRANLQIADIVLDTYPYNGATTTLETLWMGIPLVTRVGEQFAARNSYTFLCNVGVKEGIAWTEEEYVEWGVRLGKDRALRQKISWQLWQSRQTSPLWNAKQFAYEMEKAYKQMWKKYLEIQ